MIRKSLELFEKFNEAKDVIAIIEKGNLYTYADLTLKIDYFARELKESAVKKGSVTVLIADYSFDCVAMFLALFKNGNIVVPITTANETEIIERIGVCGNSFVINLRKHCKYRHHGTDAHFLIDVIRVKKAAGLILFSSGTTGKPKAMIHDLDNLVESYLDKKSKSLVFLVFLRVKYIT